MGDHRTVTISDGKARRLANEWHGGQSSPLYALSSSGAIVDGVLKELMYCRNHLFLDLKAGKKVKTEFMELKQLYRYCRIRNPRGPVKDWYELEFDK